MAIADGENTFSFKMSREFFGCGVYYASIVFLSVTSISCIIFADPTLACLFGGEVHHQKQEAEFKKRLGRRKGQHAGDSRIVMDHTYISFGELGSKSEGDRTVATQLTSWLKLGPAA